MDDEFEIEDEDIQEIIPTPLRKLATSSGISSGFLLGT